MHALASGMNVEDLNHALRSPDESTRRQAAWSALALSADEAKPLIPVLGIMVTREKEFFQAVTLLDRLGPAAHSIATMLSQAMRVEESVTWRVCQACLLCQITGSPDEAMPIIAAAVAAPNGLQALIVAINTMRTPFSGSESLWRLLDEQLGKADSSSQRSIAYIAQQLLGRYEASTRLSLRLGEERCSQLFAQLGALASAD